MSIFTFFHQKDDLVSNGNKTSGKNFEPTEKKFEPPEKLSPPAYDSDPLNVSIAKSTNSEESTLINSDYKDPKKVGSCSYHTYVCTSRAYRLLWRRGHATSTYRNATCARLC